MSSPRGKMRGMVATGTIRQDVRETAVVPEINSEIIYSAVALEHVPVPAATRREEQARRFAPTATEGRPAGAASPVVSHFSVDGAHAVAIRLRVSVHRRLWRDDVLHLVAGRHALRRVLRGHAILRRHGLTVGRNGWVHVSGWRRRVGDVGTSLKRRQGRDGNGDGDRPAVRG